MDQNTTQPPINLINQVTTPPPTPKTARSKFVFLIAGVVVALIIFGGFIFVKLINRDTGDPSLVSKKGSATETTNKMKTLYSKDTDGDIIPDNVETAIGTSISVSEIKRCAPSDCLSSGKTGAQLEEKNILFIIDSSGSMGMTIGGKTKMDVAKEAITSFVSTLPANIHVGIMQYGHLGSNAAGDKAVSCASADVVGSLGSVTTANLKTYLDKIKPVGWTPIGLAINKAIPTFVGKENQKNQIIIVSDGAETCDTNPVLAASTAKNSAYKIQVDVIGLAVTTADQTSLDAISKSGGGLFSVANDGSELVSRMKASNENFKSYMTDIACINQAYTASTGCIMDVKSKVVKYMLAEAGKAKGADYEIIYDSENKVSDFYQKEYDRQLKEWTDKQKASQQELLK